MIASVLLAAALALNQWPSLDVALAEARKTGQLIVLYISPHAAQAVDDRVAKWLDDAWKRESVRHAFSDVLVAHVDADSPLIQPYEEIVAAASFRRPHFVALDPGGGVIMELQVFGDPAEFAGTINALHAEASSFANSAKIRAAGNRSEAFFARGFGLANAGLAAAARDAYEQASAEAENVHDDVGRERARLGLAALDSSGPTTRARGLRALNDLAAHAIEPDVRGTALLLLGHARKEERDPEGAIAFYRKAYALAPAGSAFAEVVRRNLELMGAGASASPVRLLFAHQPIIAGTLDVAASAPKGTASVAFFVDGTRAAESRRAPFRATLRLGPTPRVHTLKAVALDRSRRVLGEDAVTINDHPDRLSVRIVEPRDELIESKTNVEITARVPDGTKLESIDVYWNEEKLATLTAAPFRYELALPSKNAFGFIRAVAHDSSGNTAEDVRLVNTFAGDQARVDAVEIFSIVHDKQGKVIDDLTAADFVVKEDGTPVDVSIRSTPSDPITVALALDESASMRPTMMNVADYASAFLHDSLKDGDRTMIVGFDAEPHLTQPLTADLQHVSSSLFDARTGGGTAIWDAIAFSLAQLRGVPGKRSLLVFTDGLDNGSRTTPAAALALAQEAAVPVYIVLTQALPTYLGARALDFERLAYGTAGAIFRAPKRAELARLFDQVRNDTRGQYILSFVSRSAKPHDQLRRVAVQVPGRRVEVRAMSGYYPR